MVSVAQSTNAGVFDYDSATANAYKVVQADFAAITDLILAQDLSNDGPAYYFMQQSIPKNFPELARDLVVPKWVDASQITEQNLWFGGSGNVTPLHYDAANNFLAQICGKKRVTLFDPMQTAKIYPFPITAKTPNMSYVNIEEPDFDRFPEFRSAQPIELVLGAGDLLFLPAYWWHHVRSLEVSISVNFWWDPSPQQHLVPAALRMIPAMYEQDRLASLRPMVGDFLVEAGALIGNLNWLAVLFAGAALEGQVRGLCRRYGILDRDGERLRTIESLHAALIRAKRNIDSSDARGTLLTQLATAVSRAKQGEGGVSDAEASALLDAVRAFTARKE